MTAHQTLWQSLKTVAKVSALTTALISSVNAFAEPIEIKFSHVVAENTPKGQMALKFKELVEQRLPGEYTVSVFPSSQLFGDNNELAALLLNDVQIVAPSLSKFERYTKKLQIFDLPFLFEDMEAVDKFQQSESGQKLLNSMNRKGIVGLGYLHNGMKQFSANEPLTLPQDANGKKFRIMASDVIAAQFDAVKAIPVKKPFSEVFTLLQTRAIDGQENTWSNIYSMKFYEVQSHITESNHGLLDYMVVTSNTFWKGLPKDKRDIIKKSLDEAIALGNQIAAQKDSEDKQAILDSKRSQLVTLSAEQRQQWVNAMKPVWAKFEDQIGKDMIDAAQQSNKQ
ncbi:TRAP transporter substrate-binding protein [Shewanella aestuarii]|uniref:TRAP transporter substrate-binding protein n=1 Tax=Shewanella aestuarii TaxID=1028752 RepID=A0A6G9QPV0_9GAMM|nr:TRAP transporter substrate-binding protein [Shewanella aestuarii]QIR16133.1 TRAP transporter substrate-binding protein [Shewanella aestuarii]